MPTRYVWIRGASVDRFRARGRCACRGCTRASDLRGAAGVGVGLLCSGVSQRRLACPAARPPIGQLPNAKDCGSVRRRSFQQHPARVGACRRRRPARLYPPHAERRVGARHQTTRASCMGEPIASYVLVTAPGTTRALAWRARRTGILRTRLNRTGRRSDGRFEAVSRIGDYTARLLETNSLVAVAAAPGRASSGTVGSHWINCDD